MAFATILAVVAGLTITAAASFAHDIYANVIQKGRKDAEGKTVEPDPNGEVRVARRTVIVIGILAIVGGIGAQGQNIAFLVALAFAVAASANLPTILYSLFWRRFTTRGAVWSMYGGLGSAIILIILSPVFSGTPTSMIPGIDIAIWPLNNPGIVSIPLGFALGWLGTITSTRRESPQLAAEMEVRSHRLRGGEGRRSLTRHPSGAGPAAYSPGPHPRSGDSPGLEVQQEPLPFRVAAVVPCGAVGPHHPVHGHDEGERCEPTGGADGLAAPGWPARTATSP